MRYDVTGINEILKQLKTSYDDLGQIIASDWSSVSQTMGEEWIGPDELSFETELAKRMCELYKGCRSAIETVIANIRQLGNNWRDFQNNNHLNGVTPTVRLDFEFDNVTLEDYPIENYVKAAERTFTTSMRYGLVSGVSSAEILNKKITEYVNTIGEKVKSLYQGVRAIEGFCTPEEAAEVVEYLNRITQLFASIVTKVEDLQTALVTLVQNYETTVQDHVEALKKADTETEAATNTTPAQPM